jgi:hypothetical protein
VPGQRRVSTGKMSRIVVPERANYGDLISPLTELLKVLANLHTGNHSRHWLELAANFDRSVRLHIQRVELRWSSPHEEEDAGLGMSPLLNAGGKSICVRRSSQTSQPGHARLKDCTTREAWHLYP